MSRSYRAFRSTLVVSVLGYCAQALSLVAIPLFLKTVGAEGYGLMVTVMAFMGYLTFADAGLSWGSMILIAQAQGRGDQPGIAHIVRHSVALAVGSGAVAALALWAILGAAALGWRLPMFTAHPESDLLLLIAGVGLILNLQFGIVYNLFHGLQEGYWAGAYQGGARLLGLVGAMLAAWVTGRVADMLLVQVAVNVVAGLAALVHAWRRHPWAFQRGSWTDRDQYTAQFRIGAKNLVLQVGRTLGGTAPTLALSSILGPAAVPYYTVPVTLFSLFLTPINTWSASMQSAYGEAGASGAMDWVRNAFRQSLERALLLGGLGAALFFVLGDSFVRAWTHGRLTVSWGMAASVLVIGGLGSFMQAGQYLLTGLNRHRRVAVAEIISGLLALVAVPFAVGLWGAGGVGLGVTGAVLASSAWVLLREVRLQLGVGCLPDWSFLLRVATATAACAMVATVTLSVGARQMEGMAVLDLLVAGAAGLTAFGAAALALRLFAVHETLDWVLRLKGKLFAPS